MTHRQFLAYCTVVAALLCGSSLRAQDTAAFSKLPGIVHSITFTGNKVTKERIMTRELTFGIGDTLTLSDTTSIERARQNLLNTSLFNFVTITWSEVQAPTPEGYRQLNVNIDVKERWYTWPAPVFDVAEQNINTWWKNGHNLKRATYGFMLTRYNFRGRRETVSLICRFGYAQQIGGQYSIPYINRRQTIGMTFTGLYTRFHEVAYDTRFNKLLFYKDKEQHIRKEISASVKTVWRKGLYYRHSIEGKFTDLAVNDTVVDLAADYFVNRGVRMRYFTLSYQFINDHRDFKPYPLKGYYFDVEVTRHGLHLLPEEEIDVTFVAASVRRWWQMSTRIFAGAMLRARWLPKPDPPYYHQRALGFSTYVRGFEYYVIDGQSYLIGKSVVRYQLLKPRTFRFKWLPLEKFNTFHLAIYAGLFADAAYVEDRTSAPSDYNTLGNSVISGYGAGIDFVTYYDLVFRVEYAYNSIGEGGFYLHVGAPF